MKVLHIITKGEAGGAQTHVLELCRALQPGLSLEVVIGGTDPAQPLTSRLASMGIGVTRLSALANSLAPWRLVRAVRAFTRVLRTSRPDLIHAHSAVAGVVARLGGWWMGIPVVYTVHGFGFKPQAPRLQRTAAYLAEYALAPWTAHMVCVSSYEQTLAERLPIAPQRVSTVHNGIADVPASSQSQGAPAMHVIMVARCAPPKRHDLLLQALRLARDTLGVETACTLVGAGPGLASLQQLARELDLQQVQFAGDVDNTPDWLAQHGVFVLVSDHEGLPISVIEAMRARLPVVASDLPGLRELITPGEQGILVANRAEAIAQALVDLARQPDERLRMGLRARQRYETTFTADHMAQAVRAIYDQILGHESPAQH